MLLESFSMGPLSLPNRVVMAPLTRNRAYGTVPGEMQVTYYAQRASAGLIISESIQVARLGQSYPDTPGLHSPEQVRAWRQVTDAVHAAGGRIFAQIFHGGRISHPLLVGDTPVAPSGVQPAGQVATPGGMKPFVMPRALPTEETEAVVEQFRHAAENAREANFDGVEIHGANGYLVDQFLQSGTNRRSDRYGGSVENRTRFLLEVVDQAVAVWGDGRVGVRLSPGGRFNDMSDRSPEETFTHAARALDRCPLAYLHAIKAPPASQIDARRLLRDAYTGVLVSAGGYTLESAETAVRTGDADLIAFGKLYIANPDLVERFALGAPLNEPDPRTFYGGGAEGYIDYPRMDARASADAASS
jgi:N-ethylmaleimide reductase